MESSNCKCGSVNDKLSPHVLFMKTNYGEQSVQPLCEWAGECGFPSKSSFSVAEDDGCLKFSGEKDHWVQDYPTKNSNSQEG